MTKIAIEKLIAKKQILLVQDIADTLSDLVDKMRYSEACPNLRVKGHFVEISRGKSKGWKK